MLLEFWSNGFWDGDYPAQAYEQMPFTKWNGIFFSGYLCHVSKYQLSLSAFHPELATKGPPALALHYNRRNNLPPRLEDLKAFFPSTNGGAWRVPSPGLQILAI